MSKVPFLEKEALKGIHIRLFTESTEPEDLVWHRDREYRLVYVRESSDWKMQFENELPIDMNPGDLFEVHYGEWHRLVKGSGDLVLEIKKFPNEKEMLAEKKWSMKYKKSINCKRPRGFSQKAHCAGRKKQ